MLWAVSARSCQVSSSTGLARQLLEAGIGELGRCMMMGRGGKRGMGKALMKPCHGGAVGSNAAECVLCAVGQWRLLARTRRRCVHRCAELGWITGARVPGVARSWGVPRWRWRWWCRAKDRYPRSSGIKLLLARPECENTLAKNYATPTWCVDTDALRDMGVLQLDDEPHVGSVETGKAKGSTSTTVPTQ